MNDLIRQHLTRAKNRMKKKASRNCSERQFEVSDLLFVKLQPYIQSSLAPRANKKLSFKLFGAFLVVARIGSVAYELQLPASSSVHPVFHGSQLKLAVVVSPSVSSSPSPSDIGLLGVLEKILKHR